MLQVNHRLNVDSSQPAAAEEASSLLDIVHYFRTILHREFAIILVVTLIGIGLGAIYAFITPPTFTARATMLIERGKMREQLGSMVREVPVDVLEVEGHVQLLQSETVTRAVVSKLNLATEPEFVGEPVGLAGWIHKLASKLRELRSKLGVGGSSDSKAKSPPDPIAAVASRLKVSRVGGSSVIEIEFSSLVPERAAEIANAFADSYMEDQLKTRNSAARQAAAWLQDRIKELGDQSSIADETVVQFKTKNNIIAAGGRLMAEQQLAELNTQLGIAREKTAEARARLDRIETIMNSEGPNKDQLGGTVSDTLNNPVIVKLRSEYLELANRKSDLSRRLGKEHLAVVNLERQIGGIRESISDELRRIAETYKSEHKIAQQRQANIEKTVTDAVARMQEASQASIELRQLESSAEAYRGMHKSALQRNTELVQQESFPGSEARLITRASPPRDKSNPKTAVVLVLSASGGMLLGLGLGLLRATLENVFRTSEQVERVLQVNCIALVPMIAPGKPSARSQDSASRTVRQPRVIWEVVDKPLSRFAEAIRSLKSATDLSAESIKVLGFTSALSNEGKTTIGGACALLAAHMGSRTILLDCDLRNPALTAELAPDAEWGILDVISAKKSLEETLWRDPKTGLSFLPGATKSRVAHSSEILNSTALRTFLSELRHSYDYVIVDLPPLAPIVDVRSTTGLVDCYAFVVEWGRTKMDVAEFALKKAPMVRDRLLGVVLNKVNFKTLRRYEGHRSDYYSEKLYSQYGG